MTTMNDSWQPIETVPKDGAKVLVWRRELIATAWWGLSLVGNPCLCFAGGFYPKWDMPTHWRPMLNRPDEAAGQGGEGGQ